MGQASTRLGWERRKEKTLSGEVDEYDLRYSHDSSLCDFFGRPSARPPTRPRLSWERISALGNPLNKRALSRREIPGPWVRSNTVHCFEVVLDLPCSTGPL